MAVSSAKSRTLELETYSGRSLMYIRKSKGPRTEPCGTPDATAMVSDCDPFSTTDCVLLSRNDFIHLSVSPLMP
mgnify:CR=1 FL=1